MIMIIMNIVAGSCQANQVIDDIIWLSVCLSSSVLSCEILSPEQHFILTNPHNALTMHHYQLTDGDKDVLGGHDASPRSESVISM